MVRSRRNLLRLTAIVVGSIFVALPAVAQLPDDIYKLCEDWFTNHLDDPEWQQSCFDRLEEWESQQPPVDRTPVDRTRSSVVFPPEVKVDGDRYRIAEKLRSGMSVEMHVTFASRDARVEASARAAEKRQSKIGTDEVAYLRGEFSRIKRDAMGGLQDVTVLREWENIPGSFVRVDSEAALNALLARPEVIGVWEEFYMQAQLFESLTLIGGAAVHAFNSGDCVAEAPGGIGPSQQ